MILLAQFDSAARVIASMTGLPAAICKDIGTKPFAPTCSLSASVGMATVALAIVTAYPTLTTNGCVMT